MARWVKLAKTVAAGIVATLASYASITGGVILLGGLGAAIGMLLIIPIVSAHRTFLLGMYAETKPTKRAYARRLILDSMVAVLGAIIIHVFPIVGVCVAKTITEGEALLLNIEWLSILAIIVILSVVLLDYGYEVVVNKKDALLAAADSIKRFRKKPLAHIVGAAESASPYLLFVLGNNILRALENTGYAYPIAIATILSLYFISIPLGEWIYREVEQTL